MHSIWGDFYFSLRSYTKREQINISITEGKKRESALLCHPPNATSHLSLSHRTAFFPGRRGEFLHQRAAYYTVNICNINLPQGHTAPATAIWAFLHICTYIWSWQILKKLIQSHTDQTHCFKIRTVTEVHKHQRTHMAYAFNGVVTLSAFSTRFSLKASTFVSVILDWTGAADGSEFQSSSVCRFIKLINQMAQHIKIQESSLLLRVIYAPVEIKAHTHKSIRGRTADKT